MKDNKNDILTVKETAEFLRVPRSTVYKLAQGGLMPAQKVGRHWRFHRLAIIRWIAGQAAPDGTFTRGMAEAEK
jgi:excisionase family DNA binding protein